MAAVGGTAMELGLLRSRFAGEGVEECGRVRSDFFCARRNGGCSYEGRLFVMDKALLFVSTHSNEYDRFMRHSDVEQITVVQHGFLPSLTLSLHKQKEVFTNFHNLVGLVELMKTLKLPPPLLSPSSQPPGPSIQRMASVPSTRYSHYPSVSPFFINVEVCPFFARSGFCPRKQLCKLDHSSHLYPSDTVSASTNTTGNPSKITGAHSKFYPTTIFGQPKRFHPMETNEENPIVNTVTAAFNSVASTTVTMDTASVTGAKLDGVTSPEFHYRRSVSLPAGDVQFSQRVARVPRPSKTDPTPSSSSSQGLLGGGEDGRGGLEKQAVTVNDNQMTSLAESQGVSPLSHPRSSPVIPEEFDFSGGQGGSGEGIFVFTASPSKTEETGDSKEKREEGDGEGEGEGKEGEEEEEVVKSKPVILPQPSEREAEREGEREGATQNEFVAELAQQLQLDSDNDSIHGDLDVETQRKILDSLSPHTDQEPGPFHRATGQHQLSPVKRRPCVYFLSGFCRNGLSCPDYHGLDFDPCELEDIQEPDDTEGQEPAALPKEVKVYHADHTHISSGDKIILSPEVLVACEQQRLSYPVAFKLVHPTSDQTVFCGVLQFTAPTSDSAYLPSWMMQHLHANNGDAVMFSHVDLPKGTFVRLQPVSSAWLGIPYDKRMAMMEFQLRNFQTLTEGTKVTLTYELNRYTLKVLQCKPAKGISILNADITTDITEPADLSRFHSVVEGQAEHINLGDTVSCSITTASYRHFVLLSLPGKPLPPRVSVEVKMKKGDPDLFLCQTCTAPSQSRYTWCNQEVGDSCIHLSTENDEEYEVQKPLYAGVVSLCEDAEFSISFKDTPLSLTHGGVGRSHGQLLRDSSHLPKTTPPSKPGSSSSDETDGESLPAGHERCSTCGSIMPSLRLVMHMRHCAVSSFICPHCKAVLPKAAEKKHKYIAHDLLVCACGMEFTQFALHHHQKTDCSKRMVQCQFKWCSLSFPMDQLMNHESLCGRKRISCCLCQEEVSQLEMAIHLEAFHSIDTRDLDWSKPLQRQDLESRVSKPQFACGCGLGFEFQDDMEVHQLTDCPLRRLAESQPLSSTKGEIVG